jgi:hypothetical protein
MKFNRTKGPADLEKKFFDKTDLVGLKMRGLPYRCSVKDVFNFFYGFKYVSNSVKLGRSAEGRRTGEAIIVF